MDDQYRILHRLKLAVNRGEEEIVRRIVHFYGVSYENDWSKGYNLLSTALEKKHTEIAKLLLKSGCKVNNYRLLNSNTPLHFAVINNDATIVNMLLQKGALVYVKNGYGETPFSVAIANDNLDIAEIFLSEKKADDKFAEAHKKTPLRFATEKESLRVIEYLLRRENAENFAWLLSWKSSYTPLHWAAMNGDADIVALFIRAGVDCNARADDSLAPLHIASNRGKDGAIKILLSNGADIEARTNNDETPLHFAAKEGLVSTAKLLLLYGANVNVLNSRGKSVLYLAVQSGELEIVKNILRYYPDITNTSNSQALKSAIDRYEENYKEIVVALLDYGFDIKLINSNASSLFYNAVKGGHFDVVKILLRSRYDVNTLFNKTSEEGYTALHVAVKYEDTAIVKLLIEYGVNVNAQDKTGKTPIFYATVNGDLTITKLLLANKASIKDNPELLNSAVKKDCLDIVKLLIKYNVDVNAADDLGRRALYLTSYKLVKKPYEVNDNEEFNIKTQIAKLLLANGAKVNAKTRNGQTALHAAIQKGYNPIIEILLEYGADVKISDIHRHTSLHFCVLKETQKFVESCSKIDSLEDNVKAEIVNMLLEKGIKINTQNNTGLTALHIATQNGYIKVVETLLQNNANVNLRDINGRTALHFTVLRSTEGFYRNLAAEDHNSEVKGDIARLLLNKGAYVDAKTNSGVTVLLDATKWGYTEVAKALLEHNANVNYKVRNGFSPLHIAAERGYYDIIEVLLRLGADATCKDQSNRTALYIACQNNFSKIVKIILEYGSYYNILYTDNTLPLRCYMQTISCIQDRLNNNRHISYHSDLDFLSCFHPSVIEVFHIYIVKLKAANLFAPEVHSKSLKLNSEMRNLLKRCEQEIAKMISTNFNDSKISYYDLIASTTNSLAIYMRDENIVEVLQSECYKHTFPLYASMIKCNFIKAMNQNELIEKGIQIFHLLGLPIHCCEKIFSYLSDHDLKMLVRASLYLDSDDNSYQKSYIT